MSRAILSVPTVSSLVAGDVCETLRLVASWIDQRAAIDVFECDVDLGIHHARSLGRQFRRQFRKRAPTRPYAYIHVQTGGKMLHL